MSINYALTPGTEITESEQRLFSHECFPIKAIHTRLEGTIRIRIRKNEFPRVYIKSKTGITEHNIVAVGDHWELSPTGNANERPVKS